MERSFLSASWLGSGPAPSPDIGRGVDPGGAGGEVAAEEGPALSLRPDGGGGGGPAEGAEEGGGGSGGSVAHATHPPRLQEPGGAAYRRAPPVPQVVCRIAVVVAAQTAQVVFVHLTDHHLHTRTH